MPKFTRDDMVMLKFTYYNALLLFKQKDWYEAYYEDAQTLIDITLTAIESKIDPNVVKVLFKDLKRTCEQITAYYGNYMILNEED